MTREEVIAQLRTIRVYPHSAIVVTPRLFNAILDLLEHCKVCDKPDGAAE